MLAQQYAHRLPADYPMERIRERITSRGPAFDATPGLGFKAFAIRERGRTGAASNVYSSIYPWDDAAAAVDFFTDERFAGVLGTFGRPQVETALPLAVSTRPEPEHIRVLTRQDIPLGRDVNLQRLRETEADHFRQVQRTGALGAVSALDTAHWRLLRYTLARYAGPAVADQITYDIVHLARPGWAHHFAKGT